MRIIHTPEELRVTLARLPGTRALVPTMGCLHAGHMRLIEAARPRAAQLVVSIYVNPLQFGPNEDLARYPRTFEDDCARCRAAGVDVLFHPATLYENGGPRVSLTVDDMGDVLCGASRPGHFAGVLTVVNILFNLVRPDLAVFGEKDWQQLTLIRRMVRDLHMGTTILGVPTVRESDGLAMSSRNRYLDRTDRARAGALYAALASMAEAAAAGERDCARLIELGRAQLHAAGIAPEYLEIRHADSLQTLHRLRDDAPARAFVAARVGHARLIDNMPLTLEGH
ncbi:MAG: pantoate--beta-alanine ligase [Zetaproteobacteria bacterium]|nr:MAG: pantoate--beta-alanine ligase [Zetaproteobacteria bacterium]